ncbi:MAG: cytochrome bd ubiquinol oxidase subunit [Rubrobacteraceae bacterium]|jgi:cytochrome d ubiquinol oxidase subunit I|nr:cytochrome bd ubiquinol oxidase subunit [Rubrobacteraceae bacterium]
MSLVTTPAELHSILAQLDFSNFRFPGGVRGFTGVTMLIHIFFAELFVGFAIAAPVLQAWGARTGSPRMDRLAHSMVRFNVLTFSSGATFAVLFLVLLVGFYPRVTAALFTHFFYFLVIAMASMILSLWAMYSYYYKWDRYSVLSKRRHAALGFSMGAFIWIWMVILSGIDTFMVTGGGPNAAPITEGNVSSFGAALSGIFNPMFVEIILHRTFANLSWPAFAVAAWGAFMYMRSKTEEDKAFYDWATSVGLTWGTGFLLVQPISGFFIAYAMQYAEPANPANPNYTGAYERLTQGGTSSLLYINLILVVGLFVLSNVAMYIGAGRHPDRGSRRPIQFFGLIAALAGLYAISPSAIANFPFFYMRYVMLLVMILATLGTLVTYLRGRMRFRYGSPVAGYRVVLLALGVLAAVTALNMGFMKSNSRAPYTVYNQPQFTVESERPPGGFGK